MSLVKVWKPFVELQHFVLKFAIAATIQPVDSQSSPVGDPEAVAPTQASTTTTATVEPEIGDAKYKSDVHEENTNLRAEKRSYQRRKRTERVPKDPEEVPVAEVGPNVGFDETEPVDKNIKGKVVGDEHVYCSSDAYSIETDSDNETRRESRRIVFDKTAEKVMWQLGMVFESVNDFRDAVTKYSLQKGVQLEKFTNDSKKVRVRCREGCPWLLYASLNRGTNNFVIKTYNPTHRYVKTTRNYMCNAKFLYMHYKDRISEQPNIRIFKFQQLIRNELGIHVGKTITRRSRQKILQELMGDHVKEFGRIFYYRDELLKTNPGSTCVVKVDDSEGNSKLVFQSFYTCFDACRKAFLGGCRKCIGLDGCFLKNVTKGQFLVDVAKDANNQMLPIAWSIVEYENKNTWAWFLKLLIEDLGLGDGRDYTLISYMQKGLTSTTKHLLPEVEHRMCARHILANWAKDFRGLERRNQFQKCARSTFEAELTANLAHMALLDGSYVHTVDMRSRTCSCKSWMLKGIPCPHVIAFILYKNWEPIDYVDDCYSKDFVVAGPSNEAGTSRAISKPRGRPRKTHITTTEAPATDGEPPRPKGRHVNPDAPPPRPRGRLRKTTNNEAPATSTIGKVPTKRSRIVGMGVFIAKNGLPTYNSGLSSNRILHTSSGQPISSVDVTGDLGFKPRTGVRWKGKKTMTSNQLEVMRDEMRVNKRQKKASSQSKEQWK
ncbi:hypothetical protein MTR67_040274 [Solanum verrucosum]|uniref:SWIM-type domain-containing protein n=1 Tax=Solanum verrucosum TaxID=315347 RepID=A0AAF0UKH7_SOLVR|nr:hypothetical protein MTR67_040274 [Solanum verrucosum]